MFGRKKKKLLAAQATNLAILIDTIFSPLRQLHGGELPSAVTTDKFILGYMWGMIRQAARFTGLTEVTDTVNLRLQLYEIFFPGQGVEIINLCANWYENQDEEYVAAVNLGLEEAVPYHKAVIEYMTGKTDVDFEELGQSLHSLEEHLDRKYIQGSTPEYRTLMDRLLSDKRILPSKPAKPEDEVVTVSIYIAEQAVKRSGKNIESLSDEETFVAMLIVLVSTNVLSAAANVSFELTGGVACTGLCLQVHPDKTVEEIATLVREVIDNHNKMATDHSKIVEAIGTQTEKFFSTANDEYLSKQSELFQMLSKKLAEGS